MRYLEKNENEQNTFIVFLSFSFSGNFYIKFHVNVFSNMIPFSLCTKTTYRDEKKNIGIHSEHIAKGFAVKKFCFLNENDESGRNDNG